MSTSTLEQSKLVQALRNSPIPALRKLSLEESESTITIRGKVSSFYLKQLAQETILPLMNGRELSNRVQVVNELPPRDYSAPTSLKRPRQGSRTRRGPGWSVGERLITVVVIFVASSPPRGRGAVALHGVDHQEAPPTRTETPTTMIPITRTTTSPLREPPDELLDELVELLPAVASDGLPPLGKAGGAFATGCASLPLGATGWNSGGFIGPAGLGLNPGGVSGRWGIFPSRVEGCRCRRR